MTDTEIEVKPARKLRDREEKFCQAYLRTGNRITAYKEAGYRWLDKDGKPVCWIASATSSLVHRPAIAARLAQLKQQREERAGDSAVYSLDWLRVQLMEVHARAIAKEDMASANRALELIGKTMGVFRDGVSVTVERQQELTKQEQDEARKLAQLMLLHDVSVGTSDNTGYVALAQPEEPGFAPGLPAVCETVSPAPDTEGKPPVNPAETEPRALPGQADTPQGAEANCVECPPTNNSISEPSTTV